MMKVTPAESLTVMTQGSDAELILFLNPKVHFVAG